MRLTRTTSHAIRILVDCAEAGGALVKTADIARRLDITPLNVFKIVHLLSRAGFVEPVRGRNGGVRLARPAEAIRVGEVVRAIEAPDVEVAGAEASSRRGDVKLTSIFDEALEAFITVLDGHSLADMARQRTRGPQKVAPKPRPAKAGRRLRSRPISPLR